MGDAQENVADITPQEEEKLLKQPTAEELRQEVISEYGFDEEVDSDIDKIDKLVAEKAEFSKTLSTAIKQKRTWREKANKAAEPPKPEVKPQEPAKEAKQEFSIQDIRALQSVHDDDVDFVAKWAKSNNITVAEAVKDKDLKVVLERHTEERRTAEATNTGGGRRGASKASEEAILEKASGFEDLSEEEMAKAHEARLQQKRKNLK